MANTTTVDESTGFRGIGSSTAVAAAKTVMQ